MTLSIGEEVKTKPTKQNTTITLESTALASAMDRVTDELNKLNNVFSVQSGAGGDAAEIKPEDMPHVPGGKLATIMQGDEVVFKAPDTTAAVGPLGDLGDKATLAAGALEALYNKLSETAPVEAEIAGAAFGEAGTSFFGADGEGEMAMDGEEPLSEEEKIAQAQETEEAIGAIKNESAAAEAARKAKEAELAKKNMLGMIGMTKFGQKASGAIKKAESLKNTIASTAEAISEAAASAPPPWNIPPIAMAVATGAAQIATIKGQFHDGIDSVPANGSYLLEKGERVVDRRLNTDLKGYLDKGRSSTNNTIDGSITMNFAEGTSPDTVYENRYALEQTLRDLYDEYAIPIPFDQ